MENLKGRDLLSIADLKGEDIQALLTLATDLKSGKISIHCPKILGLLFYKASTRTRVSFTSAMYQLGGQVIDLNPDRTQVGRGEPLIDTARVLDRYIDILAIRTFNQDDVQTFADYCDIPIINALTDLEHPCQILADLLTIQECFGQLSRMSVSYVGDGNNVAYSLLLGGALMGMKVKIATPVGYELSQEVVDRAKSLAQNEDDIFVTNDAIAAVKNTQVIYTDVWASMGQEDSAESRIPIFQPYQVNGQLLSYADPEAIVLHCLPAHRGEEITDEVMEGKHSKVWDQAENRMHVQKALVASLLGFS